MNDAKHQYRIEKDSMGEMQVPADAMYGASTARAVENFPVSSLRFPRAFIKALGNIKIAAAEVNGALGKLDQPRVQLIREVAGEVASGRWDHQFVLDIFQTGSGTSTNMNANEVIANRALQILGLAFGDYKEIHPLEHVNLSQSTNDVYPTSVKVALRAELTHLVEAMEVLRRDFEAKSHEFADVLKMGRTQMQEAVPMTLGQEFSTYAVMLAEDQQRLREAELLIQEINLGATAIGTGINAPAGYAALACNYLSEITGVAYVTAANLVEATQDAGAFVQVSGVLKRVAVKLSKVSNDLRLLSSGPRAGFAEINLPPVQAGSSIMPGKVNPVIPEVVNQIAFEVIGNDVTVSFAAEGGQLQLNAFEPIIAHNLFNSAIYLRQACLTLAEKCVRGITANRERLLQTVENSVGLVTALNPYIGYENATAVAKEAHETGKGVAEVALARGLLTREQLNEILRPETLTRSRG